MKARRAIPLDTEDPISTNTVPVGLFKALANGNGSSNGYSSNASITGEVEDDGPATLFEATRAHAKSIPPVARQPARPCSQCITWSRLYRRASLFVISTPARCSRTHRSTRRTSHAGSSCIVLQQYKERMAASIKTAQLTHAELLAHTITKADANSEKDIILESISSAEAERDQLRAKVDEIQALMLLRSTNAATSQALVVELGELEKPLSQELNADKQALASKRRPVSLRGSGSAANGGRPARIPLAALVSQAQTNEPELKELRRVSERTKVLESEHMALQRRCKEQETHIASTARARPDGSNGRTSTRRNSRTHSWRASRWRSARSSSPVPMQLDKKDAKEHLAKDRESKLRGQVSLRSRLVAPPTPSVVSVAPTLGDDGWYEYDRTVLLASYDIFDH
ncbi:hypothetical protein EDB85DRAFT_2156972 [Lactarius pseudohatsudake]|nr:hypothetical protein EDB85DRAFT_2156972 [Lactarius pseudohatsudake]